MKIKLLVAFAASILLIKNAVAQSPAAIDFKTTPKGVFYHIFKSGDTTKIKVSDVITFHVIQKTEKDSVLFSTYIAGNPVKIQVTPSQSIADLMDIFPLMALKDSALVKVPADSLFKGMDERRPPFLPKGSFLVFNLKIARIQSLNDAIDERNQMLAKMKAAEAPAVAKYIADNKLLVKTTLSGLKYVVTSPSLKRKPLKGDTVIVNYTGRLLNGQVFDSSVEADAKKGGVFQEGRPYEPFPVVVGAGSVIKGWDEGLLLLNEGSKATFIIPSALAYGDQPQGGIPPFSPLVFDIQVVKIKPTKHIIKPVAKKGTKALVKKTATAVKKVN